jgi:hypothetical protein
VLLLEQRESIRVLPDSTPVAFIPPKRNLALKKHMDGLEAA